MRVSFIDKQCCFWKLQSFQQKPAVSGDLLSREMTETQENIVYCCGSAAKSRI